MRSILFGAILLACITSAFSSNAETMSVPGPDGPLEGEAIIVPDATVGVIIIPGSGPTDRDGNSPAGMRTDTYRLLANGLAEAGVSSIRIDKRGFFGSSNAVADPEAVTIAGYADDVRAWRDAFAEKLGTECVFVAGHSEGGLVALAAAADGISACGLVLLSSPGRPIGTLMREQFRTNPANGPYLDELDSLLGRLERGEMTDIETISPVLRALFREGLQRYMIQLFAYDPAELARSVTLPTLVVQGDRDLQITAEDARILSENLPNSDIVIFTGMTHMLKDDVAGSPMATYQNPDLPLTEGMVKEIVRFLERVSPL